MGEARQPIAGPWRAAFSEVRGDEEFVALVISGCRQSRGHLGNTNIVGTREHNTNVNFVTLNAIMSTTTS